MHVCVCVCVRECMCVYIYICVCVCVLEKKGPRGGYLSCQALGEKRKSRGVREHHHAIKCLPHCLLIEMSNRNVEQSNKNRIENLHKYRTSYEKSTEIANKK